MKRSSIGFYMILSLDEEQHGRVLYKSVVSIGQHTCSSTNYRRAYFHAPVDHLSKHCLGAASTATHSVFLPCLRLLVAVSHTVRGALKQSAAAQACLLRKGQSFSPTRERRLPLTSCQRARSSSSGSWMLQRPPCATYAQRTISENPCAQLRSNLLRH
jgi:hypothetical protein